MPIFVNFSFSNCCSWQSLQPSLPRNDFSSGALDVFSSRGLFASSFAAEPVLADVISVVRAMGVSSSAMKRTGPINILKNRGRLDIPKSSFAVHREHVGRIAVARRAFDRVVKYTSRTNVRINSQATIG